MRGIRPDQVPELRRASSTNLDQAADADVARKVKLQPADIVLVHGTGWLSSAIRKLTRSRGERPTWVSHVAIAVSSTHVVEALSRGVVCRPLAYPASRIRVYTPKNVSERARIRIAKRATAFVGQPYGWGKLVLHGLDGLLGGARVFRRLGFIEGMPICSYVVAAAYEAEGLTFGLDTRYATPDDIHDFVSTRHDKYQRVL